MEAVTVRTCNAIERGLLNVVTSLPQQRVCQRSFAVIEVTWQAATLRTHVKVTDPMQRDRCAGKLLCHVQAVKCSVFPIWIECQPDLSQAYAGLLNRTHATSPNHFFSPASQNRTESILG